MRRVILMGVMLSLATPPAAAGWYSVGAGPALAWQEGTFKFKDSYVDINGDPRQLRLNFDTREIGLGLALETAPIGDRLFNYRLAVEVSRLNLRAQEAVTDDYDLDGFSLNTQHTFGIAAVRTKPLNFFVGPSISAGLGYAENDEVFDPNAGRFLDLKLAKFFVGFGPEVGLDFHVAPTMTLGLAAGYQWGWHYATLSDDSSLSGLFDDTDWESDGSDEKFYFKLSFLFHKEAPKKKSEGVTRE